jgi:4,5-dihydroxyphthalate decarboxylase
MLELSLACQNIDRTRALLDGRVTIEGCRINIIPGRPEEIFQRAFRHQEFDISEISVSTHVMTTARGEGPYVGIPVFLSRAFRHSSIYVRADSGIERPEALNGRRIGVPDFQQTAGVWARGMLADEYGLKRGAVEWHMGGLEQPGRSARTPLKLNGKMDIRPIGPEQTLSRMLAEGELDAVIAPREPSTYGNGSGNRVERLFPDYRKAEEAYFVRTGLFPIMHAVGIRRSLVEKHPWLPVNVYAAFAKARAIALEELSRIDTVHVTHPWIVDEIGRVRSVMGSNFWSYGVKANAKELEAMLRYAMEDGLIDGPVPLESLFAPSTFDEFNF